MNTIDHGSAPDHAAETTTPLLATADADCEKVATVLDRVETGDATPEDVDYLIDHADDCSPCFSTIEKQRLFVSFLQGHVAHKGVPASLAAAIRASIAQDAAAQ